MSESELAFDIKKLCGIFGSQLVRGEVDVVERQRIFQRGQDGRENFVSRGLLDGSTIKVLKTDQPHEKVITVFHELFHYNFPTASEDSVETEAVRFFHSLSPRQRGFFEFVLAFESENA